MKRWFIALGLLLAPAAYAKKKAATEAAPAEAAKAPEASAPSEAKSHGDAAQPETKPEAKHEEPPPPDDPDLAHVGSEAPDFRLPAFNPDPKSNGSIALNTYVGGDRDDNQAKLVVLSFMASYCKPCKKEMPYLQQLYTKYKDKGLRVIMVSVDTEEKNFEIVQDLIKTNQVTFPVLKDRYNLVARRYLGTQTPLPSLFIVGVDGNVQVVKRGYNEEASKALLAEVQKGLGVPAEALK
jgi:alkyl hydroperoxide reductase subunit AhpC